MHFNTKSISLLTFIYISISGLLFSSAAWSAPASVEPEADEILQTMSEYLSGLKKFTVTSHSTIETLIDSGQKIMLDFSGTVSVQRPDKFYSTRNGDMTAQSFYFNGKTFILYNKAKNFYGSIEAAGNLDMALDKAVSQFNLIAPGADLIYTNSYERLSKDLISGFYVGKSMIGDVEAHHLAFRSGEVDWQIWIQTGDRPLPLRYVITSRWISGSPQFSLNLQWDTQPNFSGNTFNFVAPEKAEKIDILPR